MASNIGPRIGIEGEDQFRKELAGIGNDLKVLASESKAVSAEFANQTNAQKGLSAQNEVLAKQAESLNAQLEKQEKAYQAARDQLGETNEKTKKWEIALNNTRAELANTEGAIKANNDKMKELKKENFHEAVEKIGKGFKAVGTAAAAAGAAVGATIGAMVKSAGDTAKAGDEIDKMSQKLGMSAEAYQEWDYVLKISGTEMSNMSTGLKTLTNKLDDAKNGSESAQGMFAQLGLSMEELSTMSREDVFAAVVNGFQGMADSTERAALANDIFGKSGQELAPLFNTTAEETQELINKANEYGMVMSEDMVKASADYVDAQTTLQGALGGLKNQMMGELLPSLTDVALGLAEVFGGDPDKGIAQVQTGIENMMSGISESLPKILELGGQILVKLLNGIIQQLPQIFQSATTIIKSLVSAITDNLPTIIQAGIMLTIELIKGILLAIPDILKATPDIIKAVVSGLKSGIPELAKAGLDLVKGLWEGIKSAGGWLIGKMKEWCGSIVKAIKGFFGIHSPSTVFAGIGENMALGLGEGFEEGMNDVDFVGAIPTPSLSTVVAGAVNGINAASAGGGAYTFNILLPDGRLLAEYVFNPLAEYAKANGTPILNPV